MYYDDTLPWRVIQDGETAEGRPVFDEDGTLVVAPYRGRHIVSQFGDPIAEFIHDEGNARRIIACVNACKGIPTEALECQTKKDLTAKLIALNRELLAVLDACVTQIEQMRGLFNDQDGTIQAALDDAYKVIQAAKGGLA